MLPLSPSPRALSLSLYLSLPMNAHDKAACDAPAGIDTKLLTLLYRDWCRIQPAKSWASGALAAELNVSTVAQSVKWETKRMLVRSVSRTPFIHIAIHISVFVGGG